VEALKSKKNDVPPVRRPSASNVSTSGSSSSGSGNSLSNPGDGSISAGKNSGRGAGKGDDDFGDDRPSSAGASSPLAGGSTLPTEKKTQETDIVENSGVEVNESEAKSNVGVANDASSNSESNPWAHMHLHEFAPKIVVVGVGGAGTNAVNNMVASGLSGVEFLALNTDAQHLSTSLSPTRLQIGTHLTSGLGCGANPDAGRLAAEESRDAIESCIEDAHMVFITAGMGGGTGTGAAPVVAGLCYDLGILTVSVVTTPFRFEGTHRRRLALEGVERLKDVSDTLIVVPNQNLFRLVGEKTSFVDSFRLADNVLLAGVRSITDLMTSPGLINLDFADVQSVMHGMGNALLGTGQACHDDGVGSYGISGIKGAEGKRDQQKVSADDSDDPVEDGSNNASSEADECRAIRAAKMALNNPLLGEGNMDIGSAKGMLVNITGGSDMTLYEVDRAAEYITDRVLDPDANIIFGSAYDANLTGCVRVSVVATGIDEGQ